METKAHDRALQHIENAQAVYYSGKELPLNLKIKAGICHVHLGNIEMAQVCCMLIRTYIIELTLFFLVLAPFNCSLLESEMYV